MEHRIVEDFENLRVLSGRVYALGAMDDLARDFAVALDDASRHGGGSSASIAAGNQDNAAKRPCCKKRRYKKRKPSSCGPLEKLGIAAGANRSEASESSLDEALLKGYGVVENNAPIRHSDSDDLLNSRQVPSHLKSSHLQNVPALVESDSVTETFSPNRPQRRRRYFKRMAVDPEPEEVELIGAGVSKIRAQHPMFFDVEMEREYTTKTGSTQPGKRKRSTKDKSDDNSLDLELGNDLQRDDNPENMYESCSSSVSSTESNKGHNSNEEEGQEGDDEQSDWYHEVDSSSTNLPLPGHMSHAATLPSLLGPVAVRRSRQLCPEFHGAVDTMQLDGSTSRLFRHQLMPVTGRDIQSGRRRLKDWRPLYSLSCFLEERQKWNPDCQGTCADENKRVDIVGGHERTMDIQGGGVNWTPLASSGQGGNSKRHRLMPPTDQVSYTVTGVVADTSHEPSQLESSTAGRSFTRGNVSNRGCYS